MASRSPGASSSPPPRRAWRPIGDRVRAGSVELGPRTRRRATEVKSGNLRFHQLREQRQRFLPAKGARLGRDDIRQPRCTMFTSVPTMTFFSVTVTTISPARFGSSKRSVQRIRSLGTSSRYSPPKVALARREIRKRHLVGATDPHVRMVHSAGESVWRQPPTMASGVEKSAVDPLGRRSQNSMKLNGQACPCSSPARLYRRYLIVRPGFVIEIIGEGGGDRR